MRREELRAAIDRDPEAIVEWVMTLTASVAALRVEVDELMRQLGRDSRNSSLLEFPRFCGVLCACGESR